MDKDMKKDVLGRLIEFKEYTGKSLHAFCTSISVAHTTVFGQVNGDRALSLDTVLATVASYKDLSAEWLLRGTGSMIVADETSTVEQQYQSRVENLIETIRYLSETIKNKNATIDALQAALSESTQKPKKA